MHVDNLECDCQVTNKQGADGMGCQYLSCPISKGDDHKTFTFPSVDGIYMHTECWDAYDKEWKALHPEAYRDIQDAETANAERRAGA